jgi:hypothetical protein
MEPDSWDPSSVSPSLTPKYLTPIADEIWRVQTQVHRHMQPQRGDDEWVAGCTAWKRRCFALERLQRQPGFDWLWAGYIENQFHVRILGFPLRIYRATWEGGVPDKYSVPSLFETMMFPNNGNLIYRIELIARPLAKPSGVALVEVNDETGDKKSFPIPRSAVQVRPDGQVRRIRERKPPVIPPATEVQPTEEKKPKSDPDQKETSA